MEGGMTPFAQTLVRQAMAQVKPGTPLADNKPLASSDCRCFEVTQVLDLMEDLVGESKFDPLTSVTSFLPAPITWIEFKQDWGRSGCMLQSFDGSRPATQYRPGYVRAKTPSGEIIAPTKGQPGFTMVQLFHGDDADDEVTSLPRLVFTQCDDAMLPLPIDKDGFYTDIEDASDDAEAARYARAFMAALAIINTPRIVGRRQHMPHAGLQRELARKYGMVGKFPLQAWTEIKLEVTPPIIEEGVYETHLTGQRALHFCRAFLRIRLGRLEMVKSHWRGDPAIGIRQSRYTVIPPRLRSAREMAHAV
jgi:hypothetical protein